MRINLKSILCRLSVSAMMVLVAGATFAAEELLNIDWTGKKVSILGDSYSTFEGTPGCIVPEYPGTYDVTDVSKVWWARVIKEFGGELDTNRSCGRSFISNDSGNGVGGFLPRAKEGLGNPDIIMIFGGLNDSWFNTTEVENNFESGINALFSYIKGTYKNATKYVIIPKAHVAEHYKQGCLAGYRSKLKASAKKYGMTPVDLDGAYGFGTSDMAGNQNYPHPNAQGMKEIANRVIQVIRTPPTCEHPKCGFETTKAPTCIEAGMRVWKCLDCSKNIYTNNIPAMQHAWSEWTTDPNDSSKDKHTCLRCSASESIAKSASHSTNLPANWGYSNRVTVAGINYCVLTFTNTAETIKWTLPRSVSEVEFLTVGGGAGGGCAENNGFAAGGGGGGGAAFVGTFSGLTSGSVATIIVGTGGAGSTNSWKAGENGGDSTLGIDGEISCAMGGGGGGSIGAGPGSWGTGGGATARGGSDSANAGGKGLQGGRGGNSQPYNQAGYESYAIAAAGGGGAGGAGGNSEARKTGGTGGVGLACDITGETLYYGGGGGGGVGTESKSTDSLTRGVGGLGGGGTGGIGGMDSGYRQPDKGTPGTFFGGGGGGSLRRTNPTGNGYQGIVIVRYMDLSAPAGHTHYLSDFVTTVPATCSSEGVAVATCTNSGCTATPLKVTKMLAKLPHELGGVTVVTQPQVGQAGKMQQTCAVCGAVVSTTLPALTSLGNTDTEARTYTWLGESGSIWGLKENWKSNKSSSYGIPNSKDFATAVFPASLGSPLTVINPDYYQVKTLSVLAAAPVTLLGGSYSLSDSSFNFASGATLILDNSKIHTPRLTPRDAEDVTIIVRNAGVLDIEKGGLNYNSMSARMKVRVEGKNSEANIYSNSAMGPSLKGEGHIWEVVNGGKISNNQGKSLFSDNETFSQVLPTIRVSDGGLFEVQYSDFLYGTRDDADTPTLIIEGKDSRFVVKQAIVLGTNTVTSGGPTTLRFIPPAEGWSSSPMNSTGKIIVGDNTRIEVDASKVVMTSTSLDIPLLSSSESKIQGSVSSLDKSLTPPAGATASLRVVDERKIVLHLETGSPTGKISVSVPTAIPNLVYTGSTIVGVSEGTGYTVSGGSATDVGSYTATCKISNPSIYEWKTGGTSDKTVTWSIAKAQNTWTTEPSYSNGRLTAAATKFGTPTATIQPTGGSAQAFTGTLPTTPGTYTLVYTAPAGTSNYSAPTTSTKTLTFEIKEAGSDVDDTVSGLYRSAKSGNWGDAATWTGVENGSYPHLDSDGAMIDSTVTIDLAKGSFAIAALTNQAAGTIIKNGKLTTSGKGVYAAQNITFEDMTLSGNRIYAAQDGVSITFAGACQLTDAFYFHVTRPSSLLVKNGVTKMANDFSWYESPTLTLKTDNARLEAPSFGSGTVALSIKLGANNNATDAVLAFSGSFNPKSGSSLTVDATQMGVGTYKLISAGTFTDAANFASVKPSVASGLSGTLALAGNVLTLTISAGTTPDEPPVTEGIWAGKYVAILGDSYSTFLGTPGCENPYYPDGEWTRWNSETFNLSDMWWQRVITATDATLTKNLSMGGSPMTDCVGGSTFLQRLSNSGLKKDEISPDFIFIFGGMNDHWLNSNFNESQFSSGIESLFQKIDQEYPSAKKYVIINKVDNRTETGVSTGYTWGLLAFQRSTLASKAVSHGYVAIDLANSEFCKSQNGDVENRNFPHATPQGHKKIADYVLSQLGVTPAPSHTHSWSVWTTNGVSCTTAGTRTRTCSGCSETKTENVAALGHNWQVTSETATTINYECSRCHETRSETKGGEPTVSDLPAEYQLLEYVKSTGSQYIDTGVAAKNGLTVKLNFKSEKASSSTDGILAAYSNNAEAYLPGVNQSGEMIVGLGAGTRATSRTLTTSSNEVEIAINSAGGFTLKVNGSEEGSQASCATPTSCTLYFFARNTDNKAERLSQTTLYAAKFYEDGTKLIRYFVPVKKIATQEVGLYDLKNGTFYAPQGGTLMAGPAVNPEEPVNPPSPPEPPSGELPSGYTPLTAVKTSGKCWFDTGIVGQPNLKVEANFVPSYFDKPYQYLLGSCDNETYAYQRCDPLYFKYATVNLGAGHGYKQDPETTKLINGFEFTIITTINASGEGGTVSVNGEAIESRLNKEETAGSTINAGGNGKTLYLATRNQGGSPSTNYTFEGEIRYVKIWTNGTVLARSYVPCRAPNGDVGFYDVAGGQGFQKSTGSEQFEPVGGSSDPEETPTVKPSEGKSASTITVKAANADAAKAQVEIEPPTGVSIDKAMYAGYFKKSAISKGNGEFEVSVELDSEKFKDSLKTASADIVAQMLSATKETLTITAKPGLYYSLREGSSLDNMTEGARVLSTGSTVNITRKVKGGNSGFYQVLIHAEPKL